MKKTKLLLPIFIIALLSSCVKTEQADLVVHNAQIYTLNPYLNQAEAMAITNGKIIEIGDEHQIMNRYQAKEYHDMKKAVLVPAFVDAHAFALRYAWLQGQNNLQDVNSIDELLRFVTEEGKTGLFIGVNVKDDLMGDKLISYLDYFPNLLYVLKGRSGLRMAMSPRMADSLNISNRVLNSQEVFDVWEQVVDLSHKSTSYQDQFQLLKDSCLKLGICAISEMASEVKRAEFLRTLEGKEDLKIKIYQSLYDNEGNRAYLFERLDSFPNFQLGGLDLYLDEPLLSGRSSLRGEDSISLNYSTEQLIEIGTLANTVGAQLIFHCFGDSAVGQVAQVAAEILGEVNDKRWRVEQSQFMLERDIQALKKYTLLPGFCPQQAPLDLAYVESEYPQYRDKAYPFKKAFEANRFVTAGSAAPLDELNPLRTFRIMAEFLGADPAAREIALKAISLYPAMAMFMENEIGSLDVGKEANFVELNGNLIKAPSEILNDIKVQRTYIRGKMEYHY